MFRIGDFSRLANVPVRTLHYYDQIGLFQPVEVDPFTSYRYYSYAQLSHLSRIFALKDLGFTLDQIARILQSPLSADELSGMLRLRQEELESELIEVQERLARIEARLNEIRKEGIMTDYEMVIKNIPDMRVVCAREIVETPDKMRERCMALIDSVFSFVKQNGIVPSGPDMAIYHDVSESGIDTEMAVIVQPDTPSLEGNTARVRDLVGTQTMACATYRGSYDDHEAVRQLHLSLAQWIEASGYRPCGAVREIYLQPPQKLGEGAHGVMELNWPVEKV
ncbi:MAG: MerR family transcriptional regulator [Anaerolineae bacterium]|nr:MerR family transcriptional regulator [Anaerolineae bacterium]MCA9892189.1 MerR family transcriptional regulator [Anaerolineae bacterium]